MKYLYMNEQEWQMQYYQFQKFLLELLDRCIPVKIDGVSRREAMANDNMQIMKNILKI